MRPFTVIGFAIVTILLLTTVSLREGGTELEDYLVSLQKIEETTFNITQSVPYTSPYKEDLTVQEALFNLANGIVYAVVVELNTLTAFTIIYSYKYLGTDIVVNLFKIFTLIGLIWLLGKMVVPVGATFILLEDIFKKKNKKVPKVITLILSILVWVIITVIGLGLITILF